MGYDRRMLGARSDEEVEFRTFKRIRIMRQNRRGDTKFMR